MKTHPTEQITPHPMLARMPMMGEEEFGGLCQDIAARGIEYPIQVVELDGDVVAADGRHRLAAAKKLGLKTVPVVFREPGEAADIIIGQLVHRRHYPKGVIAYLVFPLLPNIGHGGNRGKNQHGNFEARPIESVLTRKRDLCRRYGFSEDLYDQAKGVHEIFAEHPDFRELYEPMLLSGEIGLGRLHAGMKGGLATKGKKKEVAPPEKLIEGTVEQLEFRWGYWEQLGVAQRRHAAEKIALAIAKAPEEVRLAVGAALHGRRKR